MPDNRLSTIPSSAFIAQIKQHEGFRALPYTCTAMACTIGYGTNLQAHPHFIPYHDLEIAVRNGRLKGSELVNALKKRGMSWCEEQAHKALMEEVESCKNQLIERCPVFVQLLEKDETARAEVLLNMAFNLGVDGLLRFKNTLALLNLAIQGASTYDRVANGMLNSLWAKQVGRRARELADQMRNGKYGRQR